MNVGVLNDQTSEESLLWLSCGSDENGVPNLGFESRATFLSLLLVGFVVCFWAIVRHAVQPNRELTLFIIGITGSFILAVANGANDIANSVGTSVGAGALTMTQAIVLGCIFEFLGAVTLGSFVSKTISKGVVEPTSYTDTPALFSLCMFSVLWGAGTTTLIATFFGLPISATHGNADLTRHRTQSNTPFMLFSAA